MGHDPGRRPENLEPRRWLVGGGVVLDGDAVLLVENVRRDGRRDWSPPGGVIDRGETLVDGLSREVEEETGLHVVQWVGPVYRIEVTAPDMGWHLRVEVHQAAEVSGSLVVDDPDGIVVAARFIGPDDRDRVLSDAPRWVREPLVEWLGGEAVPGTTHTYEVDGTIAAGLAVTRTRIAAPDG